MAYIINSDTTAKHLSSVAVLPGFHYFSFTLNIFFNFYFIITSIRKSFMIYMDHFKKNKWIHYCFFFFNICTVIYTYILNTSC